MEAAPHHKKRVRANGYWPYSDGSGLSGIIPGKPKPCMKFFSTCGCPYGEGCHYSHNIPGGISALGTSGGGVGGKSGAAAPSASSASEPSVNLGGYKTRLCNQFGTRDGCRFGDKCHFAHGESELQKLSGSTQGDSVRFSANMAVPPVAMEATKAYPGIKNAMSTVGVGLPREPSPPGITTSLVAAKVSINAGLEGTGARKGGVVHTREMTTQVITGGLKIPGVLDHEKDPHVRSIESRGTFDQFKTANQMVKDLLMHKEPLPPKSTGFSSHKYKTKMCENFAQGTCTFGERCHFAHGDAELRKPSFTA